MLWPMGQTLAPWFTAIWAPYSFARGSTTPRKLILTRRCGSILVSTVATSTWGRSSSARGSTRRRWLNSLRRCGSIPASAPHITTWASFFLALGNYAAARDHFALAIRLKPFYPDAYNSFALLMAACREAKFRDGEKAVEFATRACELTKWKDPRFLSTLAAAQAEAGDFDAAVWSQKRAIELVTVEQEKDDYRSRLALYQAKRPHRTAPPLRVD